jgi:hypothetical protein
VYWREDSTRSRIWYYGALEEEGVQEAALGPPTVLCGGASGGQRLCCKACGRQPAPSLDPLVRVLLKISPSLRRGCPGPHHRTRPHEQGSRGVSAPSGHWYRGRPRSPESVGRPHCSEFSTHIALSLSLSISTFSWRSCTGGGRRSAPSDGVTCYRRWELDSIFKRKGSSPSQYPPMNDTMFWQVYMPAVESWLE